MAHSSCGSGCSSSANWQYFNGSLADLSVYQNQLPSAGTVAAQYAAETHPAAELTTITSPAGRTELSATYDTVNDRVATAHRRRRRDLDLRRRGRRSRRRLATTARCMGSSPEDFWPLNDTAGPLAARPGRQRGHRGQPAAARDVRERDAGRGGPDRVP